MGCLKRTNYYALFILITILIPLLLISSTCADPGDLDTTFNTDGIVTTDIVNGDQGFSVAIQGDGKIVVGGYSFTPNKDFAIVRYNSDGSLDSTFGTGGIVTTDFAGDEDGITSIMIQSDGKIVAVGGAKNATKDFALARYTSDGTLDSTFGTGGQVSTDLSSRTNVGYGGALQDDGKILVVGRWDTGGGDEAFIVARYNSDGSLDNSFDTDGIATTNISGSDDIARSVIVQPDGKIVVAGYSNNDIAVVRYNSDGSLDNSFDLDGIVTTAIGGNEDYGFSIALQDDDKIVVAGYYLNGGKNEFVVVRYNSDGSLDTTFDSDGIVTTNISGINDEAYSVAIQPDGKIVVAGEAARTGAGADIAIVRYNSNGSLDTTFNTVGIVTRAIGGANDWGYSVALQDDGKIVAAGWSDNGVDDDFAVVRFIGLFEYTLTVSNSGDGSGTVTSSTGNIDCGAACTETVNEGSNITLTATATSGSKFSSWSGDCSGSGSSFKITMDSNKTCTATFEPDGVEHTVTLPGTGLAKYFMMVSCPLTPTDTSATSVYGSQIDSYNTSKYRFKIWNNSSDDYDEYPSLGEVTPGHTIWALALNSLDITYSGTTTQTNYTATFTTSPQQVANTTTNIDGYAYDISNGWTMVGNPFKYPINVSDIIVVDDTTGDKFFLTSTNNTITQQKFWTYQTGVGAYINPTTLDIAEGGWIKKLTPGDGKIVFQPIEATVASEELILDARSDNDQPPPPPGDFSSGGGCFLSSTVH